MGAPGEADLGPLTCCRTPPLSTRPRGLQSAHAARSVGLRGSGEVAPSAPRAGCAKTLPVGVFQQSPMLPRPGLPGGGPTRAPQLTQQQQLRREGAASWLARLLWLVARCPSQPASSWRRDLAAPADVCDSCLTIPGLCE